MTIAIRHDKQPFAAQTSKSDKRRAGRTLANDTPLEVRSGGHTIDDALRDHMRERMGQKLGKYAPLIERATVRFGDQNGPRGGVDKGCLVHLVLSALPPVVIEECAADLREAFDLALSRAERATRRSVQKHGFSARGDADGHAGAQEDGEEVDAEPVTPGEDPGSLIGRRVGRARQNLLDAAARPEKQDRTAQVDTSLPGTSATDRRAGGGHTARRNTKLNEAGLTYALEDSTRDRPSRKSTRGSKGHAKTDANLTARAKRKAHSPRARAQS